MLKNDSDSLITDGDCVHGRSKREETLDRGLRAPAVKVEWTKRITIIQLNALVFAKTRDREEPPGGNDANLLNGWWNGDPFSSAAESLRHGHNSPKLTSGP